MSKRDDALEVLKSLGLPKQQQNERSCLTLLTLAQLAEEDAWSKTKRPLLRIWGHHGMDEGPIRQAVRRQQP